MKENTSPPHAITILVSRQAIVLVVHEGCVVRSVNRFPISERTTRSALTSVRLLLSEHTPAHVYFSPSSGADPDKVTYPLTELLHDVTTRRAVKLTWMPDVLALARVLEHAGASAGTRRNLNPFRRKV